ncbi:MAG: hypothetical protein ACRDIV_14700 [Ktedonobacteraceae bacterium]
MPFEFTQYPWSNFLLNGGSLTRYASDGEADGNVLVGWTTI